MTCQDVQKRLRYFASKERAKVNQWFFKTGIGQYGEGDKFIGVRVPDVRKVAKEFTDLSIPQLEKLLTSPVHEERLTALIILVGQFKKSDNKKELYDFYLAHTKWINNWDLVDSSAAYIVGPYLEDKPKDMLYTLARSPLLWERRIAMVSTFYFIKQKDPEIALAIAEILVDDKEDLIQKAVGWMLREIGKTCGEAVEELFLKKHHKTMPRTMLRYAIERFPEGKRKLYMQKTIIY